MKRASEDVSGGGGAKKASSDGAGAGGGAAATLSDKTQPIERPIRMSKAVFTFNCCTWEEVGAGELKYLPLCQTPYYMMGPEHHELWNKYKGLWTTMKIHAPKARISNLIMLQDDLINQGGTPLETTAFTQVCYMLKYTPRRNTQFFKLCDVPNCNKEQGDNDLSYNLSSTECTSSDMKQLVEINGFTDFEHLGIRTAAVDEFAGFNPYAKITMTPNYTQIHNTYIPPNDNTIGLLAGYAANLQPAEVAGHPICVPKFNQITWARNTGDFSLLKVNDVCDIPINTNIDGMPLINDPHNDFTKRSVKVADEQNTYEYYTEFCWPSNNRPYYSRKDNLNQIRPYESTKSLSPISHTFFCMPPIRKANGALLKQRCSFMLEQEFHIEFNFSEGVWDSGDEATSKYLLNQSNGIILRPNIYGTTIQTVPADGAFCGSDYDYSCTGDKCPASNNSGFLYDEMGKWMLQVDSFIFFSDTNISTPPNMEYKQTEISPSFLFKDEYNTSKFKTAFDNFKNASIGGQLAVMKITANNVAGIFDSIFFVGNNEATYEKKNINKAKYMYIDGSKYLQMLNNLGIFCSKKSYSVQNADFTPVSRNTPMFYV